MKKSMIWILAAVMLFCLIACQHQLSNPNQNDSSDIQEEDNSNMIGNYPESSRNDGDTSVSTSDETTGEWIRGNVLNGETGDIHYSYYLPNGYDGSKTYPMMMTLPGYGGMWFGESSEGNNLRETGVSIWTKMDDPIVIVSPQVEDWHDTSARQTIELTEYFLKHYAIDKSRVYGAGYSAGGETMSRVMGMRPELFAGYLHGASQWDGTYVPVAEAGTAVYIFMGEHDEYYGSAKARQAYDGLLAAYRQSSKSQSEIDSLLKLWIPPDSYFSDKGLSNQHGGGNVLFEEKEITDWLLSQRRS